jgi:MoaA/NifB/PqqE/SkfB family radical SAM enzyme
MTDSPYHRFQSMKILAYTERSLLPIVRGELPYPLDWHVFPSNVCNHKCTWCMYRQNGEQFNFRVLLPRELLLRAVRDAARTGAVLIHFSGGGEPLINKATPEAMALAQELGLKVALSTNGRLLTPDIAALVDYIRVSLNAGTSEQHHATNHGGDPADRGDWQTILANIRACVPQKRQDIGLGFVVDYENWRDIEPFCAVAADLGVDFVHIRPGFYYDAEKDHFTRACMPDTLAACERAKQAHGEHIKIFSITEKFDGYWTPRAYHRCRAVLTGVCLRATGDFAVCQDRTDLSFGAAYKQGATFEEVWHSDEHTRLIAAIHDGAGGELTACPRCVWNNRNLAIEALEKDDLRIALV